MTIEVEPEQIRGYSPWADLNDRAELAYVRTRLPLADGWYLADVPGIAIDDRLTYVQARCVLAHELAHIDLGHHHQIAGTGPGTGRIARRNENEADQLAARRLINILDLTAALTWSINDPPEIAEELRVTEHLLMVRMSHLHPSERAMIRRAAAQREGS